MDALQTCCSSMDLIDYVDCSFHPPCRGQLFYKDVQIGGQNGLNGVFQI